MRLSDLAGPDAPSDMGARVDCVYEPSQRVFEGQCELLEDGREARAEAVASR